MLIFLPALALTGVWLGCDGCERCLRGVRGDSRRNVCLCCLEGLILLPALTLTIRGLWRIGGEQRPRGMCGPDLFDSSRGTSRRGNSADMSFVLYMCSRFFRQCFFGHSNDRRLCRRRCHELSILGLGGDYRRGGWFWLRGGLGFRNELCRYRDTLGSLFAPDQTELVGHMAFLKVVCDRGCQSSGVHGRLVAIAAPSLFYWLLWEDWLDLECLYRAEYE